MGETEKGFPIGGSWPRSGLMRAKFIITACLRDISGSSPLIRPCGATFPPGGRLDCRKRCVHPLAPSARGLRPQAVGERTVRLPEIFRAMARFSPSAPSGHLPRRGRFFDTLHLPPGEGFRSFQNFSLKFGKRYKKRQKRDLWLTFCQF